MAMIEAQPRSLSVQGSQVTGGLIATLCLFLLMATGYAQPNESVSRTTSVCLAIQHTAPGCPSNKQMELAVEEILGHQVFSRGSCDIQVGGTMQAQAAGGWLANLTFITSHGESLGNRSLQTPAQSCSALQEPVSLVISLMVEARAAEVILKLPAPRLPAQRRASMAATFSLVSGLLPDLSKGATVEMGWSLREKLSLRIQSTYWFPDIYLRDRRGGEFWSWVGGAALCPTLFRSSNAEGSVCGAIQAGILHGTGVGYNHTGSPSKPYGEATARFRFSIPVWRPLHGFVEFGAAVPWLRPSFVYSLETTGALVEVHRPRVLVLFGGVGLELDATDGSRDQAISP